MARSAARARVMWIEANPVFGGSRSQVQFPADLSGFFGLPKNAVLDTQERAAVACGAAITHRFSIDIASRECTLNSPRNSRGRSKSACRIESLHLDIL